MKRIEVNQGLVVVLIIVVSFVYLFVGTSDYMDTFITEDQQSEVIGRLGLK